MHAFRFIIDMDWNETYADSCRHANSFGCSCRCISWCVCAMPRSCFSVASSIRMYGAKYLTGCMEGSWTSVYQRDFLYGKRKVRVSRSFKGFKWSSCKKDDTYQVSLLAVKKEQMLHFNISNVPLSSRLIRFAKIILVLGCPKYKLNTHGLMKKAGNISA